MNDNEPKKTLQKSQGTRKRIVEAALALFNEKGYAESTMRDIAKKAGVSLGLTYRYFTRKEELVLALYDQLALTSCEQMRSLPKESLAKRFPMAISLCLESLGPHRGTLGALFSAGLSVNSSVAVLGEGTADVRDVMWKAYCDVLTGSADPPKEKQAEQLATMMYTAHLLTVLFWLQDRSEDQQNTMRLVGFYEKAIKLARPFLRVRVVSSLLGEFCDILQPLFGNPHAPKPAG